MLDKVKNILNKAISYGLKPILMRPFISVTLLESVQGRFFSTPMFSSVNGDCNTFLSISQEF